MNETTEGQHAEDKAMGDIGDVVSEEIQEAKAEYAISIEVETASRVNFASA